MGESVAEREARFQEQYEQDIQVVRWWREVDVAVNRYEARRAA